MMTRRLRALCPHCMGPIDVRCLQGNVELRKYTELPSLTTNKTWEDVYSGNVCPECGTLMIFQEACELCPSCGRSKC